MIEIYGDTKFLLATESGTGVLVLQQEFFFSTEKSENAPMTAVSLTVNTRQSQSLSFLAS